MCDFYRGKKNFVFCYNTEHAHETTHIVHDQPSSIYLSVRALFTLLYHHFCLQHFFFQTSHVISVTSSKCQNESTKNFINWRAAFSFSFFTSLLFLSDNFVQNLLLSSLYGIQTWQVLFFYFLSNIHLLSPKVGRRVFWWCKSILLLQSCILYFCSGLIFFLRRF